MKMVGSTLLPLAPWKKEPISSSTYNQEILSHLTDYSTDCDDLDILIMLEHDFIDDIFTNGGGFLCTPVVIAVDGYDFNYYNDINASPPSPPLRNYLLFNFYKDISSLLTTSNFETDPLVFKLYNNNLFDLCYIL